MDRCVRRSVGRGRVAAGRGDLDRGATARHGRTRRRRPAGASREAVERHRVGPRRTLADRPARLRTSVGRCDRQRPGGGVHDHQAVVAPPHSPRSVGTSGAGAVAPRLRHPPVDRRLDDRSRRRVGDRLLVTVIGGVPARPVVARRRRARLDLGAPDGPRPVRRRRRMERGRRRTGNRRQHGSSARDRAPSGRRDDVGRHVGDDLGGDRGFHRRRDGCRGGVCRRNRSISPARVHVQRCEGPRGGPRSARRRSWRVRPPRDGCRSRRSGAAALLRR